MKQVISDSTLNSERKKREEYKGNYEIIYNGGIITYFVLIFTSLT